MSTITKFTGGLNIMNSRCTNVNLRVLTYPAYSYLLVQAETPLPADVRELVESYGWEELPNSGGVNWVFKTPLPLYQTEQSIHDSQPNHTG